MQELLSRDILSKYSPDAINKSEFASFIVFQFKNKIILGIKISFYVEGKLMNLRFQLNDYKKMGDLFVDLYYSKEDYCVVSEEMRRKLDHAIDSVYFLDTATGSNRQKPSIKYALYRKAHLRNISVNITKDTIILRKNDEQGRPLITDAIHIPSYEEQMQNPDGDIQYIEQIEADCFQRADELLWWAFEQIVNSNHSFVRCSHCNSYFIPHKKSKNSQPQRFCNTQCSHAYSSYGRFFGNSYYECAYHKLNQKLDRRKNSKEVYRYNRPKEDENHEEDLKALYCVLDEKHRNTTPEALQLSNWDFNYIWINVLDELATRREKTVAIINGIKLNTATEADKKTAIDEIVDWLSRVNRGLDLYNK